jgi:hypothetical protein
MIYAALLLHRWLDQPRALVLFGQLKDLRGGAVVLPLDYN